MRENASYGKHSQSSQWGLNQDGKLEKGGNNQHCEQR